MAVSGEHVYDADLGPKSDLETFFHSSTLVTQTEFFRQSTLFKDLENDVLPIVFNHRKGKTDKLLLWSAGCSDGREPYSIGMAIKRWIKMKMKSIDIHVDASDINRDLVVIGTQGKYKVRQIELDRLIPYSDYFIQLDQTTLSITPSFSQVISFYVEDITAKREGALYDIIICTNVLLYYEKEYRKNIVNTLAKFLREGGFLYVETIGKKYMRENGFTSLRPGSHYFQKVMMTNIKI